MPKSGLSDINVLLGKLKKRMIPIPDAEKDIRKLYEKKGMTAVLHCIIH